MAGGDVDGVAGRLRALSDAVLVATSPEDVVDAFRTASQALLRVDQVHLIEVSQDGSVGQARLGAYEGGAWREDGYVMVFDDRPSGAAQVVATGRVVHVADTATSTVLRPDYVERFRARSALFVPLSWGGEVRWVAGLIRVRQEPFDATEIELARSSANSAAAGFALLEARGRQASGHERDGALARAVAALNAGLERDALLEVVSREADAALGGDMSGVYLGDGRRGGVATAGHNVPRGWHGYVMKPGEGIAGQVLASGRPAISSAYQAEVRLPENPGLRDVRTGVAVPLRWNGEVRGALSVGFLRMRRVSAADVRTLEAFAELAVLACREGAPEG